MTGSALWAPSVPHRQLCSTSTSSVNHSFSEAVICMLSDSLHREKMPQKHRRVWFGRSLKDHFIPTLWHRQGQPPPALAAPSPIQAGPGHLEPNPVTALAQFCPKHPSWLLAGESTRPRVWAGRICDLLYSVCAHTHRWSFRGSQFCGFTGTRCLLCCGVCFADLCHPHVPALVSDCPGTVRAGVHSSWDGMSENPCYLSLPGLVPSLALLGCLDAAPSKGASRSPFPEEGRGLCVSTLIPAGSQTHTFLAMVGTCISHWARYTEEEIMYLTITVC